MQHRKAILSPKELQDVNDRSASRLKRNNLRVIAIFGLLLVAVVVGFRTFVHSNGQLRDARAAAATATVDFNESRQATGAAASGLLDARDMFAAVEDLQEHVPANQPAKDNWDERSCVKWITQDLELCTSGDYQQNCITTCTRLATPPTDVLPSKLCAQIVGPNRDGCGMKGADKLCLKTCAPWNEAIDLTWIPMVKPAFLDCSTEEEPTDLTLQEKVFTERLPYTLMQKDTLLWEIRLNLLASVSKVLTQQKIGHWLIGGSLLGAYRHGMPFPWDDDMDLGMEVGGVKRAHAARKEFNAAGITVRTGSYPCESLIYTALCAYLDSIPGGVEDSDIFMVFQSAAHPGAWVDVNEDFPVKVDGTKGWSTSGTWGLFDDRSYSSILKPLRKCKLGQHEFDCPGKTKRYLCNQVGTDLKIPGVWNNTTRKFERPVEKWDTYFGAGMKDFAAADTLRLEMDGTELAGTDGNKKQKVDKSTLRIVKDSLVDGKVVTSPAERNMKQGQ